MRGNVTALRHAIVAGALIVLTTMPGSTAVTKPEPGPRSPQIPAVPVSQEPIRVQCWQKGLKIIDEGNLQGLSINAATSRDTVTFKREGDANASTYLIPFDHSLCLIQPAR
jgi:hypothetical protein